MAASNMAAIIMEQNAANEARYKEMLREARLKEGTAAINALYDPVPIMETRHQKGKVGGSNLPAGKFFTRTGAAVAPADGGAPVDDFDAASYLAANPDVAAATVGPNQAGAARQHYDLMGKAEGRPGAKRAGGGSGQ